MLVYKEYYHSLYNWVGPYGGFPGTGLSTCPLWRYLDNNVWCAFPEFYNYEPLPSPNGRLLLHDHEHIARCLLVPDNVNCCDTTLLPHHQPVRELCMNWSHTHTWQAPPSPTFKNALLKHFVDLEIFWSMSYLSPCITQQQNFLCSKLQHFGFV